MSIIPFHIPPCIQQHVSLKDKNWFRTGGSAEYFAAPESYQDIQILLEWAEYYQIPITVIGDGANILIADAGINGLVIRLAFTDIGLVGNIENKILVQAGAGVHIDTLIQWSLHNS